MLFAEGFGGAACVGQMLGDFAGHCGTVGISAPKKLAILSVNVRNDKFDLLAGFGGRCHLVWSVGESWPGVGPGWGGGCSVNGDCELVGFVANSEPSAVRSENVVASAKAFDVVADCHSGNDLSALLVALAESEFD